METIKGLIEALQEVNAKDIRIYITKGHNPFFDYALVASAVADRQMDGLISKIYEKSTEYGFKVKGVEGRGGSGWLLIDCGDAIINLMTYEERTRYDLDGLWIGLDEVDVLNLKIITKM